MPTPRQGALGLRSDLGHTELARLSLAYSYTVMRAWPARYSLTLDNAPGPLRKGLAEGSETLTGVLTPGGGASEEVTAG